MTGLMFKISGAWLVSLLAGLPMFVSMGLAALGFMWLGGFPISMLPQKMAGSVNSFPIVAAPLFILMGHILGAARLTDRIVEFATAEEAVKAVEQFHNKEFQGRPLTVNIARPKEERAPRWSGGSRDSSDARSQAR